jgi:hypothetical protein
MVIPENIDKMLQLTHTFGWIAGVNSKLMSHLCRTCGAIKVDHEHLSILITPALSESLIETIKNQPNISFTIVNALTFESYQFKGKYVTSNVLNPDLESIKQLYMKGIEDTLGNMGFKYGGRFNQYSGLEGIAIKMKVGEIFDQTPKQGTGKKLLIKEPLL